MIITIDRQKNITFDFDDNKFPNVHIFHYLPEGLHFLAKVVRNLENNNFNPDMPKPVFQIDLTDPNLGILTCYFHWFANTLVNYLRFVGLIEILKSNQWEFKDVLAQSNKIKKHCSQYVETVIPDVLRWRNKVSAHFSATDPRKEDNLADLHYSVMYHVSYNQPYYEVGSINIGKKGYTTNYKPWQLTKLFEDLSHRFWEERTLTPLS